MSEQLNIIITGKSGVGKSSFLNYLVDKDIFKTGIGEPVTQEYFEKIDYTDSSSGIKYCLYDTKGIEPDTTNECANEILGEIDKRDKSDDLFEWIHTVYYCFAASSKRIEPFEVDFVKKLIGKGVSVVVLLTKKDLVPDADLMKLKEEFLSQVGDIVQLVPVCSVEMRTRKGASVKSGKGEVLKASFLGLWDKLAHRLPYDVVAYFEDLGELDVKNIDAKYRFDNLLNDLFGNDDQSNRNGLSFIFKLPTLYKSGCTYLDFSDRRQIRATTELVHDIIGKLQEKIVQFTQYYDRSKLRQKHTKTINIVLDFFKKVSNSQIRVLYQHKTADKINDIKNFFIDLKKESDHYNELHSDLDRLADCVFFDSDEKRWVRNSYEQYYGFVRDVSSSFTNVLNNYVSTFQAELHQYGQYCIRKDELYADNFNEEIYRNTFTSLYSINNRLSDIQRQVLDELRIHLKLSELQAMDIEQEIVE